MDFQLLKKVACRLKIALLRVRIRQGVRQPNVRQYCITERGNPESKLWTPRTELWADYRHGAMARSDRWTISQPSTFYDKLESAGFMQKVRKGYPGFVGIGLPRGRA